VSWVVLNALLLRPAISLTSSLLGSLSGLVCTVRPLSYLYSGQVGLLTHGHPPVLQLLVTCDMARQESLPIARLWWLTPIILTTQEAEMRRILLLS
jgi:hypothetical protein